MEYHKLRPREVVALREQMPVAYLPLGILEWHGLHNPVGLDGVKATVVLEHLSNRLGGLVMPAFFWGDHRGMICELVFDPKVSAWLPPGTWDHSTKICETMHLSRERLEREAQRSVDTGGWRLWEELAVHTFFQLESLGFKMIVPYPGHYPLRDPLKNAIQTYEAKGGTCRTFILDDNLACPGDHAAKCETSLLLYLAPELVDLARLNPDDEQHLGVLGEDPLKHASADYGREIVAKFEELLASQLRGIGV